MPAECSPSPMADRAQHRGEIRALLSRHGHRPNQIFGQNFLAEPAIIDRIVDLADVAERKVVEVGAGTGSLTARLAATADEVVSYELDRHLIPLLEESLTGLDVDIRIADATSVDWCRELDREGWVLVANLPYNVGTGIVLDALRGAPCIDRFVVMLQREVADRFLSGPGSKIYGVPSVIVHLHARGRVALSVPPGAFEPPPAVESAVVVLDRVEPSPSAEAAIEIAEQAFGQRRKMVRRSLAPRYEDAVVVLTAAGVDPTKRAEDLAPDDYLAIAAQERTR